MFIFAYGIRELNIMNKYIRTILVIVLITISYIFAYAESNKNDVRKVLTELKEVIKENPDSTYAILRAMEIPQGEETLAEYSLLTVKAEYLATGKIESDSLILNAISYYGKTKSKETALAYYSLGCYHFGRDYDKAIDAFNISIKHCLDDDDEMRGRAYHAIGSCLFAQGDFNGYVRVSKKALKYFEGNESEEIRHLCQEIRYNLNAFDGKSRRNNASMALLIILSVLLMSSLGIVAYLIIKRRYFSYKEIKPEQPLSLLENKLKEGKSAFEKMQIYETLLEIRSLNESELQSRTDIDIKAMEDALLASFKEAYHILAANENKISHQDLLLCLFAYLKVSNNVTAFFLKAVPTTIRQRKKRLQSKLSPEAYKILFL